MSLLKKIQEDSQEIEKKLPEIMDMERLQFYADQYLLSGLKKMNDMVSQDEDPYLSINAYKNVLSASKFVMQRIETKNALKDSAIELDLEGED